MSAVLVVLKGGVQVLVDHSLLPLAAIFIEPAKVLFLNNAINHGIFTPIGIEQAAEAGKSIMYMLEANPGPGLGLLLAYWAFSKDKATKDSAPGAIIIHFFGGIHEIYFPYILMNPLVIVGPIAGNICAILFYSITKAGLVGTFRTWFHHRIYVNVTKEFYRNHSTWCSDCSNSIFLSFFTDR